MGNVQGENFAKVRFGNRVAADDGVEASDEFRRKVAFEFFFENRIVGVRIRIRTRETHGRTFRFLNGVLSDVRRENEQGVP